MVQLLCGLGLVDGPGGGEFGGAGSLLESGRVVGRSRRADTERSSVRSAAALSSGRTRNPVSPARRYPGSDGTQSGR